MCNFWFTIFRLALETLANQKLDRLMFFIRKLHQNEALSSKILNMCNFYYEYEVQLRKMDVEEIFNVKEKLTLKWTVRTLIFARK